VIGALKVRALLYVTVWHASVENKGNHTVNSIQCNMAK